MGQLKTIRFKSIEEVKKHIKTSKPTFYFSSQTSTVIPYDKIESYLKLKSEYYMGDLSGIKPEMEMVGDHLKIRGAVSWKDAREFLISHGRDIKTSPTEELALVLAGLATSCTGERSFMFGNLRSQVVSCKYLDHNGEEKELQRDQSLSSLKTLKAYQDDFSQYKNFKNAPYPRFEKEIDLMIGTEGQLGVITEVLLETTKRVTLQHLFISLPKWEEDYTAHLEIAQKIQAFREDVVLVELIDSNALSYLKEEDRPVDGRDLIFFEIIEERFEKFYEDFLANLDHVQEENIYELSENKFHQIRKNVPRAVFEENSRQGVVKMGTDVQVNLKDYQSLLDFYRSFTKLGIQYNLFGHFGDCHLHFNFMPKPDSIDVCQKEFEKLYHQVLCWQGSPFAEHGIGLIKQKYIAPFHKENQRITFDELKKMFDPKNQFFPQGFMSK
jgi:FAD/FMN-containing dehydrogenase